jgi:hypothetical protein
MHMQSYNANIIIHSIHSIHTVSCIYLRISFIICRSRGDAKISSLSLEILLQTLKWANLADRPHGLRWCTPAAKQRKRISAIEKHTKILDMCFLEVLTFSYYVEVGGCGHQNIRHVFSWSADIFILCRSRGMWKQLVFPRNTSTSTQREPV